MKKNVNYFDKHPVIGWFLGLLIIIAMFFIMYLGRRFLGPTQEDLSSQADDETMWERLNN